MFEQLLVERLIQLRMQKGVSARDMSLSLGQSEGYINKIENRQILPSMQVFFYICDYFQITPSEFFNADIEFPEDVNKIAENLSHLSQEQLTSVRQLTTDLKDYNKTK